MRHDFGFELLAMLSVVFIAYVGLKWGKVYCWFNRISDFECTQGSVLTIFFNGRAFKESLDNYESLPKILARIVVRYRFQIGDKAVVCDQVTPWDSSEGFNPTDNPELYGKLFDALKSKQPIEVWFNKASPSEAYLVNRVSLNAVWWDVVVSGVCLVIIAAYGLYKLMVFY